MRTGAPWRNLPSEYGPWQMVYGRIRRWQRDGTWPELLTRADADGLIVGGRRRLQEPSTAIRHDVGRVLATGEASSRPAHHQKGTAPRRIRTMLPVETPMAE
ncbi:transposase [Streptomyces iakyrus]|uniref:transposase n=1 Tax=Streptomyces iakyrus TaxID=68219 RepID=UPI0036F119B4